jgi:hypothetical protein
MIEDKNKNIIVQLFCEQLARIGLLIHFCYNITQLGAESYFRFLGK